MAQPAVPFIPKANSQQALLEFCKQTVTATRTYCDLRHRFEFIDTEYYRVNNRGDDHTASQIANRRGDKRKIQDITMPLMESQVETAISFLTSVFLTGNPIFGVTAPPALMDMKHTMEAIIGENSIRGAWAAEIIKFFRDGEKYNFHALELDWQRKTIYSPITTVVAGRQNNTDDSKEVVWEGNVLKRMDPYNLLFDPRCAPWEVHTKGEFAGYVELYSRIALKQFLQDLPTRINVTQAFASGPAHDNLYYIPKVNPFENYTKDKLIGAMDWMGWAHLAGGKTNLDYKNIYEVITRYIRIIPRDFDINVPKSGQPQIWKVITVNDQVIVYVERCTNAHNMLPIVCGQPFDDGLGLQSKGMGEKLIPLQDLASAAWNARLASQRRKISDRALYDPSRISPNDVNSDNPSAKIPVKASVYGKNVQDAYHQIPFEDNQTGSYVADAREFMNFANQISGQNPAQQGQFVKGNKTQDEYEDVQEKSSGRQRTKAIFIENRVFVPIKEMMKLNILQYQPDGPLVSPIDGETYQVNKEELRKSALAIKISDGLLPSDKLIPSGVLEVGLQVIGSSPPLQQRYDFGSLFTYLMNLRGADLRPFELTQQQMLQNQQQRIATGAANTAAQTIAETAGAAVLPQPQTPAGA